MTYPGIVSLLVCSLTVLFACLTLPYLTSDLRDSERARIPVWAVSAALVLLGAAGIRLLSLNPNQNQIFNALALTSALLAGLCLKWVMETLAQKKVTIHEPVLFSALLVAPLVVVFGGKLFAGSPTPGVLLLWFLNGYFWHALFSDIERLLTRERIILRRREPPYPTTAMRVDKGAGS